MFITTTVNSNTLLAYRNSSQIDVNRKIKSENFDWNKHHPKPLYFTCIKTICENWHDSPQIQFTLPRDRLIFLKLLNSTEDLELLAKFIEEDIFWKRAYEEKWPDDHFSRTYNNDNRQWKHIFLEKYFTIYLENLHPNNYDAEKMQTLVKLCSPYVRNVYISSLVPADLPCNDERVSTKTDLSSNHANVAKVNRNALKQNTVVRDHISLYAPIFSLTNMVSLHITFQQRNVGTAYRKDQFNFTDTDAKNLSKGLENCNSLLEFRITRSDLDCRRIKIIMKGLSKLGKIETIDFSHCKIRNEGSVSIARYISRHDHVKTLILSDNLIASDGAESIAFALNQASCKVTTLNLRLNNKLGSEGVSYIAVAIARGCDLINLNISGCGIKPGALPKQPTGVFAVTSRETPPSCGELLARAISLGKTPLRSLDLSVNNIGTENDEFLSNAICLSLLLEVNLKRSGMGSLAMAIAESAVSAQKLRRDAEKGIRFRRSASKVLQAHRVAKCLNMDTDPVKLAHKLSARPSIVSVTSEEGTINIQPQTLPLEFGFVPAFMEPLSSSRTSSITEPPTSRRSSHQILESVREARKSALVRRSSDGSLLHSKRVENNRRITIFVSGENQNSFEED